MKKKRFYQHSFGLMFVVLICLLIDLAAIYVLCITFVSNMKIWLKILSIFMCIFAIGLMTPTLINVSRFRIEFDQDSIFIPNDWYGRKLRAQYKTKVKYDEIAKVELVRSCNNSLNKRINKTHFIAAFNKPYLQFSLHNGQVKRFLLLFFTKKQWVKIIDELKLRLIAVGNNIELPSTAEMINGKKYNPMQYNNPIKCEVCGGLNYADDYGNTDKCPNCGWMQCADNQRMDKTLGISYPMLVPLSRAKEQYKKGQKYKATFEDFINGLKFYSEMLFWYNGLVHEVYTKRKSNDLEAYLKGDCIVVFCNKDFEQEFDNIDEFRDKANIDGRLLKDIWDEVVHPCFMFCGDEHDYDFPPED